MDVGDCRLPWPLIVVGRVGFTHLLPPATRIIQGEKRIVKMNIRDADNKWNSPYRGER